MFTAKRRRMPAVCAAIFLVSAMTWCADARAAEPQGQRPAPPRQRVIPEDMELLRDVEYGKGGDRPLLLDILKPKGAVTTPRPLVVWVHGGAWRAGSKASMPGLCLELVRNGYICASISYRLSQEAIYPAQIEDSKCAIRFFRAKAADYGIDPARIGVWGSSAGGHLVALLGTTGDVKELEGAGGWADQSSRVQAVVDFFGPTDFMQIGNGPNIRHMEAGSPESLLLGCTVRENPEKAARANPITYISKDDPPFLIMHGDKDDTVPIGQSQLLHDALKKAGLDSTFHTVEGKGHGFGGPQIDGMVKAFFDKHLGKQK